MVGVAAVIGVALLIGYRPTAGPVEWIAVIGVLAMIAFAITWLSVALGMVSTSVETASNLPMPLLLLPFLGSGFVPTDSMPAGVRWFTENQPVAAATVNALVRGHWGIENRLHWVLDVAFQEDANRIRTGDAPQNMGVVRHIALNLLRQETSPGSLKTKRFRAALNDAYLAQVLGL